MIANQNIFSKCSFPLGKVGVGCLLALCLTACGTTQLPPIDDVYYSPAIENPAPQTQSTQNIQSTQNTPSTPTSSVEYIHVQDTTVTIRIKK